MGPQISVNGTTKRGRIKGLKLRHIGKLNFPYYGKLNFPYYGKLLLSQFVYWGCRSRRSAVDEASKSLPSTAVCLLQQLYIHTHQRKEIKIEIERERQLQLKGARVDEGEGAEIDDLIYFGTLVFCGSFSFIYIAAAIDKPQQTRYSFSPLCTSAPHLLRRLRGRHQSAQFESFYTIPNKKLSLSRTSLKCWTADQT